jgi:acylphosphatase
MSDGNRAVQVRITGRVQGVGFRDWTHREASGLGLVGWVRNEADGSVSALLVGSEDAVSTMLDRLRTGPRFAVVSAVESEIAEMAGMEADFRVIR